MVEREGQSLEVHCMGRLLHDAEDVDAAADGGCGSSLHCS